MGHECVPSPVSPSFRCHPQTSKEGTFHVSVTGSFRFSIAILLASFYFPDHSLGPVPPPVARPPLPLAPTEASETCVPLADGSVPRWWGAQLLPAQRSPLPTGVRAGRLARLTRTEPCTPRECSSGCWLFLSTAGRLAGVFHTPQAAAASVRPSADLAHLAFDGGPATPAHMEVYGVW